MATTVTPLQSQIAAHEHAPAVLESIQRRAIRALLENRTIRKAAKAVGRSERTLYRWLRNPVFRACLEAACASEGIAFDPQSQYAAGKALATLTRIAGRVRAGRNKRD